MGSSERRSLLQALAVSATAFVLVVLFNVAALDEPLSDAWAFPAGLLAVMFLIKAYFILRKRI